MNIEYKDKEQVWQDETTRYWFSVDGTDYGLADRNGELTLLDFEGYPIDEVNDHEHIKAALIPHYEKRIAE